MFNSALQDLLKTTAGNQFNSGSVELHNVGDEVLATINPLPSNAFINGSWINGRSFSVGSLPTDKVVDAIVFKSAGGATYQLELAVSTPSATSHSVGVTYTYVDGLTTLIFHNGSNYRLFRTHLSSAATTPGSGANWEFYWELYHPITLANTTLTASSTFTVDSLNPIFVD